jgi:hypothetical protein
VPDDMHLLQTYFQEDKNVEISGLPHENEPQTVEESDRVLFPTVLRSGLRVLCRLTVTDGGLLVLGLVMGYVGLFTPTSGTAALFIVGMGVAGIAAVIFGLVRIIGGLMGLKRSKAILA